MRKNYKAATDDKWLGKLRDLSDAERLKLIVEAFRTCGEAPTTEKVLDQFKRETGRDPSDA